MGRCTYNAPSSSFLYHSLYIFNEKKFEVILVCLLFVVVVVVIVVVVVVCVCVCVFLLVHFLFIMRMSSYALVTFLSL